MISNSLLLNSSWPYTLSPASIFTGCPFSPVPTMETHHYLLQTILSGVWCLPFFYLIEFYIIPCFLQVSHPRSWSSRRVMTIEQRLELQKRIMNISEEGRIPFKDCLVIARELNLSVEQVCFWISLHLHLVICRTSLRSIWPCSALLVYLTSVLVPFYFVMISGSPYWGNWVIMYVEGMFWPIYITPSVFNDPVFWVSQSQTL